MRHFRFRLILTLTALILTAATFGYLLTAPVHLAIKTLLPLVIVALAVRLVQPVRELIHRMAFFVNALDNRDFMIHFPHSDDPELREMFAAMNRLTHIYRDNLTEIETKRRYYDRILKIMSHELRNSITPLTSLSDDMLRRPDVYQGDTLHEGLEVINERCTSIKHFLDSYHAMTHLPQPHTTTISVEQLLGHVRQLFSRELLRPEYQKAELHFRLAHGMTIQGDKDLLTQVLINLINNALQATVATARPCIEVLASTPNGRPCITVSDNGPGIDPGIITDIFLPFYTTHAGGTGVGLCISRQIMQLHNGALTVSNQTGKGAQFSMVF